MSHCRTKMPDGWNPLEQILEWLVIRLEPQVCRMVRIQSGKRIDFIPVNNYVVYKNQPLQSPFLGWSVEINGSTVTVEGSGCKYTFPLYFLIHIYGKYITIHEPEE